MKRRQIESRKAHPDTFTFDKKQMAAATAEAVVAFMYFRDPKLPGHIRMQWLDVFFKEERFPFELGFDIRGFTAFSFLKTTASILFFSRF
jgi:hypothetical protein